MKRDIVLAVIMLMPFAAPLSAADESPCDKCRNEASKELTKCIESAISEEDKKSCKDKHELRVKACDTECKIGQGK